jgi:hypothetical protein
MPSAAAIVVHTGDEITDDLVAEAGQRHMGFGEVSLPLA